MQRKIIGLLVLLLAGCVLLAGCTGTTPPTNTTANTTTNGTANLSGLKDAYIIGIDGAYPPYSSQEKDGSFVGFDIDSARWIANKSGFDVEFQAVAWDGIIPALLAKKIDMVYSGMTITEERKQQVAFSKPYLKINQSVAVRSDSDLTFDDIMAGKVVIGSQRGTTGEMWVQDNLIATGKMPASNLKSFDNFPLAITALMNRQVDATVYDKPPTVDIIKDQNAKIIHEIDTKEEYGIAIRKEDTALLETMNKGLDLLMADPYWDELKAKYNLTGA
jgi:polar amino acid transport system substrate-binding protein